MKGNIRPVIIPARFYNGEYKELKETNPEEWKRQVEQVMTQYEQ